MRPSWPGLARPKAMHIVLVTHYYPPEVNAPAQRASDHARVWVDNGHDVTIVTAQPSHPYGRVYDGFSNVTEETRHEGIRVLRLKTKLGANAGTVGRTLNYASFYAAARANAGRIGKADVVISTSPQFFCGLAGRGISRACKAKWILEIRDIWPESIIAVGAAKPSLATQALTGMADRAYRDCDKIVSVSPGFAAHFNNRGVPSGKVALVPNGIHTDTEPRAGTLDDFPKLARLRGRYLAAYVGTFGMAHGLSTVLDAAQCLKDNPHIGIILAGSGAERDRIASRIVDDALENVVLLDQLSREAVNKLWSLVDASLVHLKRQDVFRTVIPTKLLEGMAMAKPIALGVEGVAADILQAAGGGRAFPPEDPGALADVLTSFAADTEMSVAMGQSGQSYVRREFDRRAMALRYLDLVADVVA